MTMNSVAAIRFSSLSAAVSFGLCLSCVTAVAQEATLEPPALDALRHLVGVWTTSIEQNQDEPIQYLVFREQPELNALAQWTYYVDPESKQVQQAVFGYLGIPLRTGQIQGVLFSSDGWVAEMLGRQDDQVLFVKGFGTMADGTRASADVRYTLNEDDRLVQEWTDILSPSADSPERMSKEFTKVDVPPMSLFRDGQIIAPESDDLAASLAPLRHLIGHWQSRDTAGTVQHDQLWQPRGMGHWLEERWRLANGNSGINISGIDPVTGRLTLWSINRNVIGRVGHWEVLNDTTVGQVQRGDRLDRQLIKTDTDEMLFSRWQTLESGRYVSTDSSYLVKRVSPPPRNEALAENVSESAERINYGEPKAVARIEYMQVPEGGDELYLKVENAWKKIHRARRDAGIIKNWKLMKVSRPPEQKGDYNYVVVHVSDSLDKLRNSQLADLNLEFSSEEQEILGQTSTARTMVRNDYWDLVASAAPDRLGQTGFDPAIVISMMQSKDEARHWELETSVWQKLWKQQVADGYLWDWQLWRRQTGDGFNFISVHLRPEGLTSAPRSILSREVQERAIPDMNHEDFMNAVRETGVVRDMVGSEQWTVIDSLDSDQ